MFVIYIFKALAKNAFQKDYLPGKGLMELRSAVAEFNERNIGIKCTKEDVMIGPGSKELLFACQMALKAPLLLPSPSWVSYEPQAILLQKKVIWIPTKEEDGWKLTPESIERLNLKQDGEKKLLILNYPNNPTGVTYSSSELKSLSILFKKNNILVIADEIYGQVLHKNEARVSLATFYPEGTIISEGLSKWCGAGGWRLGTFTFPKEYRWLQDAMGVIASETFSSVSAPIQYASVVAFKGSPNISLYLKYSKLILGRVGKYVYNRLVECNVTMPMCQGGFYLFPNFNHYKNHFKSSKHFCELLLEETGVALLPGVAFGRPKEELTARLAFVDFDGEELLKVLEREGEEYINNVNFIEMNCKNIVKAMDVLQSWLRNKKI